MKNLAFAFLLCINRYKFGADSHSDQFCHYKEEACLGTKPAQRRAEGRDAGRERETGIPEYFTALTF